MKTYIPNATNLKTYRIAGLSSILSICLCLFLLMLVDSSFATSFDPNFTISAIQNSEKPNYITITATVSPDHMLYRDKMGFVSSPGELKIQWPPTTMKKDPFGEGTIEVYLQGTHRFMLELSATDNPLSNSRITVSYQGCSQQTCYMPTTRDFTFTFAPPLSIVQQISEAATAMTPATSAAVASSSAAVPSENKPAVRVELSNDIVDFSSALANQGTLWVLFLAFLGGLLVSLTPCVYPMIPITLSIIGGRDENVSFHKGLILSVTYIAGLSLTYALLGLAAATFGAQIRGFIQGSLFQGLVSIIFFLLALSMFDLILIQAPAALRNRLGSIKHTGLGGIFIMGMVSGLMASPCVAAPLAGILAFIASTGSQFIGFFMLMLFAWGMSVPLLLIGAFSGSLNALPKAGEWMNRVKEFYGFLLLAAALYFARPLMGIPLTELGIALLLASFAAFLGLFSAVPDDAGLKPRVFKSFGVVAIAVACAFAISAASQWGCLCLPVSQSEKRSDLAEISWHHDLKQAMAEAKQTNQPLFIDFRADWCSVCKDLELNVFPQPEIRALLKRMVAVKIDATSPDDTINAILRQYGVVGLPTLIILRPDGAEIQELRTIGFISTAQLEKKLRQAL